MSDLFSRLLEYSSQGTPEVKDSSLKPSERFLLNVENQGINLEYLTPILKERDNSLVISCAGSGKTTALTLKVLYDIKTGRLLTNKEVAGVSYKSMKPTLVTTFLKSGSSDLQASMSTWTRKLSMSRYSDFISFSTLHAVFKRSLENLGLQFNLVTPKASYAMLRKALTMYAVEWGKSFEELRDIAGALTYTRNVLDDTRYSHEVYSKYGISRNIVGCLLQYTRQLRDEAGVVDFEDLQDLLYEKLSSGDVAAISEVSGKYSNIYIDEFQDISQIQYEIFKFYAKDAVVVAVGDDDQMIYSWRGSDNTIISKDFPDDFDPVVYYLPVNYRCPAALVSAVDSSISRNPNRYPKDLQGLDKPSCLLLYGGDTYTDMLGYLGGSIDQDLRKSCEVAILTRTNASALVPSFYLAAHKIKFSLSNNALGLDGWYGNLLWGILDMFGDRFTTHIEGLLEILGTKEEAFKIKKVSSKPFKPLWELNEEDLQYSAPRVYSKVRTWKDIVGSSSNQVEALIRIINSLISYVFVRKTNFEDGVRTILKTFLWLIGEHDCDSILQVKDRLQDIQNMLSASTGALSGISISTVHEFKGKQADSVYVWDDSKGMFPYERNNSVVDLEEERRVHYIACTRSKYKLVIIHRNGERSKFLHEMDLGSFEVARPNLRGVLA